MTFDHVGERIAEVHHARDDPAIEARESQFVAEHAVGQVGHFVGDDDGGAGPSHPDHLPQGSLGIVEVVERADAQDGVESAALERKLLGFALRQPDVAAGRAAAAGFELRSRDVHPHDPPVGRQPVEIDAVADRHVQQVQSRRVGQVLQHLVAGRRSPPLQIQVNHSQKRNLGQSGLS